MPAAKLPRECFVAGWAEIGTGFATLLAKPMSQPDAIPDEVQTESQALKKLKEERAADAEKIRQDFIKSQRLNAARAALQKPSTKPTGDER